MKSVKRWLLPAAFGLYLFVTAVLLFAPKPQYSEKEKRFLTELPQPSLENIEDGSLQKQFASYLADRLPARDFYVGLNAYLMLLEGRNVQQPYYFCKQGYLIGKPQAADEQAVQMTMQRLTQFAENTGLPASMVIVPSAAYLNQDLLPNGHAPCADEAVFASAEQNLGAAVRLVDVRQPLQAANQEQPVCYRTDHHLTAYGNYTIYAAWRSALGQDFLSEQDYQKEDIAGFYGTAYSGSGYWLTAPDTISLWKRPSTVDVTLTDGADKQTTQQGMFFRGHLQEMDKYPVYLDGNHALTRLYNADAPDRDLLVIRDSYAHCFATFLPDHYRNVYLIDLRYYRGKLSEFAQQQGIDEILYFYGVNTLVSDRNAAFLT